MISQQLNCSASAAEVSPNKESDDGAAAAAAAAAADDDDDVEDEDEDKEEEYDDWGTWAGWHLTFLSSGPVNLKESKPLASHFP